MAEETTEEVVTEVEEDGESPVVNVIENLVQILTI